MRAKREERTMSVNFMIANVVGVEDSERAEVVAVFPTLYLHAASSYCYGFDQSPCSHCIDHEIFCEYEHVWGAQVLSDVSLDTRGSFATYTEDWQPRVDGKAFRWYSTARAYVVA